MKRLLLLVLIVLCVPHPALAQGAEASGWWSDLPAPPDVGATDLLLQGGDPLRLLPNTGVVDQKPAPTAYGAVRFHVVPGSAVGALQLAIASGGQAKDVRAYPTTTTWKPEQGGALADAPAPDLGRYSAGRLVGDSLVFPDIGRLVTDGGDLSVVLLPGAADRVVVHAPSPAALTVVPPAPVAVAVVAPAVQASAAPPAAQVPVLAPIAAAPVGAAPSPQAVPAPVAAAPPAVAALVSLPARAKRLVSDDSRSRLVVLAEGLLVLVFFGLLGQGPLALLAREQAPADTAAGIGRFRAVRVGQPPRL